MDRLQDEFEALVAYIAEDDMVESFILNDKPGKATLTLRLPDTLSFYNVVIMAYYNDNDDLIFSDLGYLKAKRTRLLNAVMAIFGKDIAWLTNGGTVETGMISTMIALIAYANGVEDAKE